LRWAGIELQVAGSKLQVASDEYIHIAPKSGNIGYIIVREALKWQQTGNRLATSATSLSGRHLRGHRYQSTIYDLRVDGYAKPVAVMSAPSQVSKVPVFAALQRGKLIWFELVGLSRIFNSHRTFL
jgi:hypothetical protein